MYVFFLFGALLESIMYGKYGGVIDSVGFSFGSRDLIPGTIDTGTTRTVPHTRTLIPLTVSTIVERSDPIERSRINYCSNMNNN
jgi:hypothetical protein